MRPLHALLLCILGAALLSPALCNHAEGPDNCCFRYYPRRVMQTSIASYNLTDDRCPKRGIILLTHKSLRICVDPNFSWVQRIMKSVDERLF